MSINSLAIAEPGAGIAFAILWSMGDWDIYLVDEVRAWIEEADSDTHLRIVAALDALADVGPGLGRPLVDTIRGSSLINLKELRVGTARILFVFDPWRASILLVAGDKS